MKKLVRVLGGACLMAIFASFAGGASMTMTGMISDSLCGASHAKMTAMHKGGKMTDTDCTLACVKAGAKFVFVSGGKVYGISNQTLPALTEYAGQDVKLTGDLSGDSITVSKVAANK